jgi:hypothetical protein
MGRFSVFPARRFAWATYGFRVRRPEWRSWTFKDVDRKPVQPRLQDPGAVRLILIVRSIDTRNSAGTNRCPDKDPGATRLQLRVKDTDAAVKTLVASGATVITAGGNGGPIDMQGLRVAVVRELNNLFLVTMTQGAQPARPAR